MLEDLFGSKTRARLLTLFFNNVDSAFYIRGIARDLKENINSVRREIQKLEKMEILESLSPEQVDNQLHQSASDKQENRKYYQVNKNYTLFEELRALILKSKLLVDKKLLEKLSTLKGIKILILSGIFVANPHARADILIVGNVNKNSVKRLITSMEKNFSNPIRYSIMTMKEFDYRNRMTDKFLFEILEGKKHIILDKK